MSAFSVSGLSSGLDTKTIIDQLMSIESRPKQKLEWNQQLSNTRQNVWKELNTKLGAMKDAADALLKFETWQLGAATPGGTWSAASGDPSRLSAIVNGTPTAGTYNIAVQQMAQAEISRSTGNLGGATAGVRATGTFVKTGGVAVTGTETLTSLRTAANGTTGLATGSKITMDFTVNGAPQSATFTIGTDGTTLAHLRSWAQTQVGNGATATWNAGKLEIQTAPGTNNELSNLQFSATTGAGVALPNFNALAGATSAVKTAATNGGVTSAQTMTVTQGGSSWNISLAAGDQMSDIVNKINSTSGIGVFASIDAGALKIQSNTAGSTSAFTVTSTGSAASMLNFSEVQTAQNAQYTVDGVAYSATSNSGVTNGLPGVTLNFNGTTSTTLTVGQGTPGTTPEKTREDAIVEKVKAFATAYNSVLDFIQQKTQGESKVTSPANKSAGLSLSEYLSGPLARNVQMSGIATQLRSTLSDVVAGMPSGGNMLSDLGITAAFDMKNTGAKGKLTVDDAKLRAAIQADPSAVQKLLGQAGGGVGVTSDDGFLRRMSEMAGNMALENPYGAIGSAVNRLTANAKSLQDGIDRAQRSLDMRRSHYEKMYASMETMLGKLQSQGSWLSSQISSMQNSK